MAHRKLDVAVLNAYGWPQDLSDEEILSRLLALNLDHAPELPTLSARNIDTKRDMEDE